MSKTLLFSILFAITLGITIPESYAAPGDWHYDIIPYGDGSEAPLMQISYEADVEGAEIVCLIQMATAILNGERYVASMNLINKPITSDDFTFITDIRERNIIPIVHVEDDWVSSMDIAPTNGSPIITAFIDQYVNVTSPITTLYDAGMFVNEVFLSGSQPKGTTCATAQSPDAHFIDAPYVPSTSRITITDENSQLPEMAPIIDLFETLSSRDGIGIYSIDASEQPLIDLLETLAQPIDYTKVNGVELEVVAIKISPEDKNPVFVDDMRWGIYRGSHGQVSIHSPDYEMDSPSCAFLKTAQTWNDSTRAIKIPGIPDIASCTNFSNPGSILADVHHQINSGPADPNPAGARQLLPTTPSADQREESCCGSCAVQ